jgi:hypothetical protein
MKIDVHPLAAADEQRTKIVEALVKEADHATEAFGDDERRID